MPCLLCDGSIPLTRRLTGSQFCSAEHERKHVAQQRMQALAALAQWRKTPDNTPPLAGFAGLSPDELRDEERGARGAETPIPRFYEVVVMHGRRRRAPTNPMGDRVAPTALAMPLPIAPAPGVVANATLPQAGKIALGKPFALIPAGAPSLQRGLPTLFDPCGIAASPVCATLHTIEPSQDGFRASLVIPQATATLAPSLIRMPLSAPKFDLPQMRSPSAPLAATLSIALPARPVLLETAPSAVRPQLDLEAPEQFPFDGLTPAEFAIEEQPQALPTTLSGSSAPVYAAVGFPIYPVWLPALFSISSHLAKLRRGPWFPAIESPPRSTSPGWIEADGPGFSGSLAWPASPAPYRDFVSESASVETRRAEPKLEANKLTMTHAQKRPVTAARLWRSAPAFAGGFALIAALIAPIIFFGSTLQSQLPSSDWSAVKAAARARATVDLQDDFHSGFESWSGPKGWASAWSVDSFGMVRPGRLALFHPSLSLTDYRFDFVSQIDSKGFGFVFRAADTNNYQAAKLIMVKPGPLPSLALVRYTVINGREGPKTQIPLRIEARRDTIYRMSVTVQGDHFSVDVNGQLASGWTDDRLKSGGVGFFSDKGESSRLVAVHVVDKQDFLGWLCSQVSPWTADRQVSGVKE